MIPNEKTRSMFRKLLDKSQKDEVNWYEHQEREGWDRGEREAYAVDLGDSTVTLDFFVPPVEPDYFKIYVTRNGMVEAIVRDKKRLIPCAAYCDKEYGVGGFYVGVPCILGSGGVEKIIELELDADERAAFEHSVDAVKKLVEAMGGLVK